MRLPNSQQSRAVLVGTAAYDPNSGFPPLPAVENNLTELETFLRTQTGLQNIVRKLNPEAPVAFGDALSSAVEEAEDLLLFYYAGHGMTVNDELVLTYSASHADKAKYTTVPYSAIRDDIARSSANIKLVVLDCCYSGKAHGNGYLGNLPEGHLEEQTVIEGAYVLTATGTTRNFASASGSGGCTAFTGALLEVLRAGTRPQDQFISMATLFPLLQAKLRGANHPIPRSSGRNTASGLALARNPMWLESRHKRFFRDKDIELPAEDFTAVGVGYISGDASPGPLLSDRMRLVAAFDDEYVFIDPDPTALIAARERQRIFGTPNGSWQAYGRNLISRGGGVWSRTSALIPISPQANVALDLQSEIEEIRPDDLIEAILCAPVDVLLNGGTRLLLKASDEFENDTDRLSDESPRINVLSVRAAVICESGNRITTPRGQIEFCAAGGRFERFEPEHPEATTAALDYEWNIRFILTQLSENSVRYNESGNEELILRASADYRLNSAIKRSRALRTAEYEQSDGAKVYARMADDWRYSGKAPWPTEEFPSIVEIRRRAQRGRGLTVWELAQLAACEEIRTCIEISNSVDPPTRLWVHLLPEYFPTEIARGDLKARVSLQKHPHLKHIGAQLISCDMIHLGGIGFVKRIAEHTSATTADIAQAFEVATELMDLRRISSEIWRCTLPEHAKVRLALRVRACLDGTTRWFLRNRPQPIGLGDDINLYSRHMKRLKRTILSSCKEQVSGSDPASHGLPRKLADDIAICDHWPDLPNMIDLHLMTEREHSEIVQAYVLLCDRLPIDYVRAALVSGFNGDRWWDAAIVALHEQASSTLQRLALAILEDDDGPSNGFARIVARWESLGLRRPDLEPGTEFAWSQARSFDLARLSVFVHHLAAAVPAPL